MDDGHLGLLSQLRAVGRRADGALGNQLLRRLATGVNEKLVTFPPGGGRPSREPPMMPSPMKPIFAISYVSSVVEIMGAAVTSNTGKSGRAISFTALKWPWP